MKYSKYIKIVFSFLLVVLFVCFFYKEFQENWEEVRNLKMVVDWKYLVSGIFMMIANYLCITFSWHIGINNFDNQQKLKFTQSIALVNISQLGKYIPGKLWSYMIQIYWLASKGFPKTTVLYLNIVATLLSILVSLLLGCTLLLLIPDWNYLRNEIVIFICLLLIINLVLFNKNILRFFLKIISIITEKNISLYQLSTHRIISMELINIAGVLFWALAGYLIALGIGFSLDSQKVIFISAAMLLGDVIGLLILIAPGGLGVREGTMFLILKDTGMIQMTLIFPILIRLLSIVTDLIMGTVAVLIISRSKYFLKNNK